MSALNVETANCIACHQALNFTDFAVHNTGVTQIEYDAIHGEWRILHNVHSEP